MERFVINALRNEVEDKEANLVWKRCLEGHTLAGESCDGKVLQLTWYQAMTYAASCKNGWRLPTIMELLSIFEGYPPEEGVFHYDMKWPLSWVWSNTSNSACDMDAWCILFFHGLSHTHHKLQRFPVRLVRDKT